MSLTHVILAAGMSTRYGRLKQLEAVGPSGEALLDYGIHDGVRAGVDRVVVVIRPEMEGAFREHCTARWPVMSVAFAHQTLEQLPAGCAVPAGRVKPWGTAHALLAAGDQVEGPCLVSNADDFYGPAAYIALAAHLRTGGDDHALVGYRLDQTLSAHGGVSRGVCEVARGRLRRMEEVHDIRRDGPRLRGRALDGRPRALADDTPVSMNLWGFRPTVFPLLTEAFRVFLARAPAPDTEFLLSGTLGELAARGRATLRVLATAERWMGVTFPGDRAAVAAGLRDLVAAGVYPPRLGTLP